MGDRARWALGLLGETGYDQLEQAHRISEMKMLINFDVGVDMRGYWPVRLAELLPPPKPKKGAGRDG